MIALFIYQTYETRYLSIPSQGPGCNHVARLMSVLFIKHTKQDIHMKKETAYSSERGFVYVLLLRRISIKATDALILYFYTSFPL